MRRYDEVKGAGARIFPDGKVKQGEHVYVYSTSWRVAVPPFCFYPWTTVAPINRDFSKAISFRWNRSDRNALGLWLHGHVVRVVRQWGLQPVYKLSLLCFVNGKGHAALMSLAKWHASNEQPFPLVELVSSVESFAPVKPPKPEDIQWARSAWLEIHHAIQETANKEGRGTN